MNFVIMNHGKLVVELTLVIQIVVLKVIFIKKIVIIITNVYQIKYLLNLISIYILYKI